MAADGGDQFGGTIGCFHDGIGESEPQSEEPETRTMVWMYGQRSWAMINASSHSCFGERVAEHHDMHGGFGELLDVGEAGGVSNVEAGPFEDEAAGVGELVIAAKDKHGSGSGHRRHRGVLIRRANLHGRQMRICCLFVIEHSIVGWSTDRVSK